MQSFFILAAEICLKMRFFHHFFNRIKIQSFLANTTEKTVVFGNCNAFQRKLLYQVIEREFSDDVTATTQTVNNQKVIVIERKWSNERKEQEIEQQNEEDENEYRRLVGLSALLLKISRSVI